jgi:hypothetical protein
MLAVVVHATIAQVVDRHEAAISAVLREQRSVVTRTMVRRWLENAVVAEPGANVGGLAGYGRTRRGMPDDDVRFVASSVGPIHPGPAGVRIWIDRQDGRTSALRALIQPINGERPVSIVLDSAATGLMIRYLPDGRSRWTREWTTVDALPRAIELQVTHDEESGIEAKTTGLPLLVLLGHE